MYLVDNSNFCYKFKSVHTYAQTLINGVSVDVSVLVGYLRSLRINPFDKIYIVLDGIPFRSLSILPGYKGQRNKEVNDSVSVPHLEVAQFLSKIGTLLNKDIRLVCAPGQEADQVISSIVHMATGNLPMRYKFISQLASYPLDSDRCLRYLTLGNPKVTPLEVGYEPVVIGTTDSDMQQLCKFDSVIIDNSTSGRNIRSTTATAVHGLPPAAIPIYKAICGDISDNVPAISKVSPDTVAHFLTRIKTKEDADSFLGIIKQRSIDHNNVELSSWILSNFSDFKRNYEVVNLKFFSIPVQVEFPDYDINTTINKYKLRV